MSVLNKLTEGIVNRDLRKEGDALLSKWEKTGLLEGITNDTKKNSMARLLENQAKELLREASTMSAGDVEGFSAVAFPIVRRVFGGLIANDLVSVQPMSLPSGLIFFLDFTFNNSVQPAGAIAEASIYGGGVVGSQLTGGVKLTSGSAGLDGRFAESGFYNLSNGYASPTASIALGSGVPSVVAVGTYGGGAGGTWSGVSEYTALGDSLFRYDPDITSGSVLCAVSVPRATLEAGQANLDDLVSITVEPIAGGAADADNSDWLHRGIQLRRLTHLDTVNTGSENVIFVIEGVDGVTTTQLAAASAARSSSLATIDDDFTNGGALGSVIGDPTWGLENIAAIPEIDIKVDSVAVTAITKKLKAKWTPELGQDLNAYHNLDAEVELTSILSEQIALEIDQEILEELIKGATAGTLYWSRAPGLFVDIETGLEVGASSAAPDFTGTVSEWYETCLERVNDVSARIHRKTLRGGANFIVTSPEVASILEFTAGFRANVTVDAERGTAGAMKVGQLSKKLDVYVDPYFPRNVILVGRRGNSFLESGFVYAPYVPLQVTPTIFGTEDFVPRKGVMTRYAKKMVRPDMYGLVIIRNLIGGAGATT
jgi:hypothetical protein